MKWREGEKMEREEILSLSISTLSPFPHSLPISSQPRCQAAAGYDSLLSLYTYIHGYTLSHFLVTSAAMFV